MSNRDWKLTTRTGLKLVVRAATSGDDAVLDELFHHVRQEELRFRFLSTMKSVPAQRIHEMTHVDHLKAETYIAFLESGNTAVGVGSLATDPAGQQGEVAISVHADYRNVGVGWGLLGLIADQARARGVKVIQCIESRANHDAIQLERNMGFEAKSFPGDATLVLLSKRLG